MRQLRDKVAVVTGAGSGIGRGLAKALSERGAHLALSDIDEASLAETADLLRGSSGKVTTEQLDVSVKSAVDAHAERVVAEHGRVNLVFNNAGVALSSTILDMRHEDLEWLMGINFWGVVHGTKAFLPHLRASGEGHVVNISSIFGMIAVPGQGAYNAAKFAVRGYTEALRQELEVERWPVSATCVHPGGIKTNIARRARMPNPKPGEPSRDEVAEQWTGWRASRPRSAPGSSSAASSATSAASSSASTRARSISFNASSRPATSACSSSPPATANARRPRAGASLAACPSRRTSL